MDTSFAASKKDDGTQAEDGTVSFSDLLRACLASSGVSGVFTSAPQAVSADTSAAGGMQVSDAGVRFIAEHEGYASTAYRGADVQNQTIGYGHVIEPGESFTSLTQPQALSLLKNDLKSCEESVNREFAGTPLTQNQFDALVSYSYNLGTNIWSKTPTLTNDIKSGASPEVLKADFARASNCNGQRLQGLVNRRLDEYELFSGGSVSSASV